jgi:hypothetical protein
MLDGKAASCCSYPFKHTEHRRQPLIRNIKLTELFLAALEGVEDNE